MGRSPSVGTAISANGSATCEMSNFILKLRSFSHGPRLLSRLTGSARKYAETIELDTIRRSTGENKGHS